MKTIQYLNVFNAPDEDQKIIHKLPSHLVARWSRVVDKWIAVNELEENIATRSRMTWMPYKDDLDDSILLGINCA